LWVSERLGRAADSTGTFDKVLYPILGKFLVFHLVVSLLTGGWTAFCLRKILAKQQSLADSVAKKTKDKSRVRRGRRPVSQTRPVLWRETATNVTKPKQKAWHRWAKRILFCLSFFPLVQTIIYASRFRGGLMLGEHVHNGMVRGATMMVLSIALMSIAVNAAAMIGRERRKKTMDELCLTRLSNDEILTHKALAAVWSVRWAFIWVGLHWVVDLLIGGLHPLALLIVPTLMFFYILFAARFGMMCSAYESTRIKAGPAAALGMLAFAGLPWVVVAMHALWLDFGRFAHNVQYTAFFVGGISPPSALAFMTLGLDDLNHSRREDGHVFLGIGLLVGMFLCWALSSMAWRKAKKRFALTRRELLPDTLAQSDPLLTEPRP
jgi:uncharacterized membrane protein (DUF485 family)